MTDIRFYHMEQTTLDKALPAITLKAWQSGKRVLIVVPDKAEVSRLDDLLWSFHPDVFLPHAADGHQSPEKQPVFITATNDNPNGADILITTHGITWTDLSAFTMVCEMLDGRVDAQVQAARTRWKAYKEAGHDLTYWQQDAQGRWVKKA